MATREAKLQNLVEIMAHFHLKLLQILEQDEKLTYGSMIMNIYDKDFESIQINLFLELSKKLMAYPDCKGRVFRVMEKYFLAHLTKANFEILTKFILDGNLEQVLVIDLFWESSKGPTIVRDTFNRLVKTPDSFYKYLSAFKFSNDGLVMQIAKIIHGHRLYAYDFEFVFRASRVKGMVFERKKFSVDIVEEKISCKTDLVGFLKFLEDRNHLKEAYSIWHRLGAKFDFPLFGKLKRLVHEEAYVENQTRLLDAFSPTSSNVDPSKESDFLKLSDFGYQESSVTWVTLENVGEAMDSVLSLSTIGIDAEFYKEDYSLLSQFMLATLQIASDKKVFIFDCLTVGKETEFKNFLIELFASPSILKAGHSFNSDLEVIERSLSCKITTINNLLDFGCDPQTNKQISLANLVEQGLMTKMCKMEQASAWNRRPLRKAQIHYAALDAVVCLKLAHMRDQIKAFRVISCGPVILNTKNEPLNKIDRPRSKVARKSTQVKPQRKHEQAHFHEASIKARNEGRAEERTKSALRKSLNCKFSGKCFHIMTKSKSVLTEEPVRKRYQKLSNKYMKMVSMLDVRKKEPVNTDETHHCRSSGRLKQHIGFCSSDLLSENDSFLINRPYRKFCLRVCTKNHSFFHSTHGSDYNGSSRQSTHSSMKAQQSRKTIENVSSPISFLVDSELSELILNMRKLGLSTFSTCQKNGSSSEDNSLIRVSVNPLNQTNYRFYLVRNTAQEIIKANIEELTAKFAVPLRGDLILSRCLNCNSDAFEWQSPFSSLSKPSSSDRATYQDLDHVWHCSDCGYRYKVNL